MSSAAVCRSYYPEIKITGQTQHKINCQVVYWITNKKPVITEILETMFNVKAADITRALARGKALGLYSWQYSNKYRRMAFAAGPNIPQKKDGIRITLDEIAAAGCHRQAAANRLMGVIESVLLTADELAEKMGCGRRTAMALLRSFKAAYPHIKRAAKAIKARCKTVVESGAKLLSSAVQNCSNSYREVKQKYYSSTSKEKITPDNPDNPPVSTRARSLTYDLSDTSWAI